MIPGSHLEAEQARIRELEVNYRARIGFLMLTGDKRAVGYRFALKYSSYDSYVRYSSGTTGFSLL